MFKIYGDKDGVFWQGDTNQKLVVEDITCVEVRLSHSTSDKTITKQVYESEGSRFVDIPDELLEESGSISVYTTVIDKDTGSSVEYAEFYFIMERYESEESISSKKDYPLFTIYGDKDGVFWQWDLNRKLIVHDISCVEVDISCSALDKSITQQVYESNGLRLVDIPDELLIESGSISVQTHIKNPNTGIYSEYVEFFFVMEKAKPEEYVCGEREVLDYKYLAGLIGKLGDLQTNDKEDLVKAINETLNTCSEIDTEKLAVAIRQYFEENPPLLPEISEEDEGKILAVVGGKWKPAGLPTYEGDCEVVPSINSKSLPTGNKFVREDVIVDPIPYSEVSNTSNGTTITIG